MDFQVVPHVGIGPVRLGMTRDEVRAVMPGQPYTFRKVPDAKHETDGYHECGFQVFYFGPIPTVEYIELCRDSGFRAFYRGVDVFETAADVMVSHVCRDADYDPDDPELGCCYVFPNLELSLWRPFEPDSPDAPDGWTFSTIGVGVRGYYSNPGTPA